LLATASVKLHLGSGYIHLDGYINVDKFHPLADVKADLLQLPFADSYADEVFAHHVIEHISYGQQMDLYEEFFRVLKPGGLLRLGYPEFEVCVKNFLENEGGRRWKWWVQTLYGKQDEPGQTHLAPIVTSHLIEQLEQVGFGEFDYSLEEANANLVCKKTEPLPWF